MSRVMRIECVLGRRERIREARLNLNSLEIAAGTVVTVFGNRHHSRPWSKRVREVLPKRKETFSLRPGSRNGCSMSLRIALSSGSDRQTPLELRHTVRRCLPRR